MLHNLKAIILALSSSGIPIPLLRDPKTQKGSISFTMLFMSFNIVLFGLIGKWSQHFDIDLSNALTFFGITSGLYFGRKMSTGEPNAENSSKNDHS